MIYLTWRFETKGRKPGWSANPPSRSGLRGSNVYWKELEHSEQEGDEDTTLAALRTIV